MDYKYEADKVQDIINDIDFSNEIDRARWNQKDKCLSNIRKALVLIHNYFLEA